MTEPKIFECAPAMIKVEPDKIYSWCTCGLSAKQPLCDGTHKTIEGIPFRPIRVQFESEEEVWFCQCKHTRTPPFCDDTHKSLENNIIT